jgi:phage-related protein
MREVVFYRSPSGAVPVEEFLETLSSKQVEKVLWVIKAVRELPRVPVTYLEKLQNSDDIWEIRVGFGGNIFRLLGFFHKGNLIILTNGFQKKSQKTPKNEIDLAEQRKKEFLSRR